MDRPRVFALVAAGGRGERFGASRPKQFLDLAGRPLLHWTVGRLLGLDLAGVTVAVPGDQLAAVEGWFPSEARLRWVAGGATRQDSVAKCLAATPAGYPMSVPVGNRIESPETHGRCGFCA
jgi:2-C-methyl-D-erythritol 4-phosphate cytidylyltransferase